MRNGWHHVARLQRRHLAPRLHDLGRQRRSHDRRLRPGFVVGGHEGLRVDRICRGRGPGDGTGGVADEVSNAEPQLLEWSQQIVDAMEDGIPKDRTDVYAREQVLLDQMQQTEVVLQAIRIGEIAIATTPTETYALTGLKLKEQSPLAHTMVIELANGADGYIPPPEQHHLGGYNTWAARSAGLEVTAEPRIVATRPEPVGAGLQATKRENGQSIGPAARR